MFDQLLPNLQRREPIELFMVDTNKTDPLLTALHNRFLQALRISVELERVRIQRIDFNRSHHGANVHDRLHSPNDDTVRQRPINEIHTLHVKLEHRLPLDLCPNPRSELEDAWEAGDSAARDHEATRDEDGIEEVGGDFAVGCEPLEFGQGARVVGCDGGS